MAHLFGGGRHGGCAAPSERAAGDAGCFCGIHWIINCTYHPELLRRAKQLGERAASHSAECSQLYQYAWASCCGGLACLASSQSPLARSASHNIDWFSVSDHVAFAIVGTSHHVWQRLGLSVNSFITSRCSRGL